MFTYRAAINRSPSREKEERLPESTGTFEGLLRSYWREESALLSRFPHDSFEQVKTFWLEKATELFRQKHENAEALAQRRKEKAAARF
jgi:hypothetical protein